MKKSIQLTWLCSRADIYSMYPPSASITASIRIRNSEHAFSTSARRELGEYSADGGDQAGFGVVGGHVGDVLDVWPNEVVQGVRVGKVIHWEMCKEFLNLTIQTNGICTTQQLS